MNILYLQDYNIEGKINAVYCHLFSMLNTLVIFRRQFQVYCDVDSCHQPT
jgi:hypothetical protein